MKQLGVVSKDLMMELIRKTSRILDKESNLRRVHGKTHIFGDIHGQLWDIIPILEKLPSPELCNYVFLGDYVDRGNHGPEVVALLICLKLKYPN